MLKKLFKKKADTTQNQTPALSPALTQSINSFLGARGLPTMPRAAQKAFELSINPDADVRDFVEVIQADEALSARIIKIANSVYFDRGRKSETIEQSVFIIGLGELRNLLNATTLNDLFPTKHPLRKQFWANAIATGIASRILAKRVLPEKAETAFMSGLMHDIGKLLLLQKASSDYDKVLQIVQEKGIPFHEAETEIFVFNHCEVGQLVARQWNFSEDLLAVIRCHHDPWSQVDLLGNSAITMPRIVKIADQIAHVLGIGHTVPLTELQDATKELLKQSWRALRLSEKDKVELLESIKKTYEYEADLYLQ